MVSRGKRSSIRCLLLSNYIPKWRNSNQLCIGRYHTSAASRTVRQEEMELNSQNNDSIPRPPHSQTPNREANPRKVLFSISFHVDITTIWDKNSFWILSLLMKHSWSLNPLRVLERNGPRSLNFSRTDQKTQSKTSSTLLKEYFSSKQNASAISSRLIFKVSRIQSKYYL
jgi:hypothetical protein